jgi:hypothetical protein
MIPFMSSLAQQDFEHCGKLASRTASSLTGICGPRTRASTPSATASIILIRSMARVRIESVQNAVDQAKCIAAAIVGRSENYRAIPGFGRTSLISSFKWPGCRVDRPGGYRWRTREPQVFRILFQGRSIGCRLTLSEIGYEIIPTTAVWPALSHTFRCRRTCSVSVVSPQIQDERSVSRKVINNYSNPHGNIREQVRVWLLSRASSRSVLDPRGR